MGDFGMSGDDLEQMYQEVILEAARDPHGREHFAADVSKEQGSAPADTTVRASHEYCTPGESHQFNPTCGDEATVHAAHHRASGVGRPRLLDLAGEPVRHG